MARPFGILPDPTVTPRDIFVSLMDTAPLAVDPLMSIVGNEEAFILGTKVINKLTTGAIRLGVPKERKEMIHKLIDTTIAVPHTVVVNTPPAVFDPSHCPVKDRNDVVWTISAMGVILIGRLPKANWFEVTVAVAGSDAKEVGCTKQLGASVSAIIGDEFDTPKPASSPAPARRSRRKYRVFGFAKFIVPIPEVNEPRFFATEDWARPGRQGVLLGHIPGKWLNPRGAVVQDTCLRAVCVTL